MQIQLLSLKNIAKHYGWPVARIKGLVDRREIRHIRIGQSIFLPENAIDEYLANNMIEPINHTKTYQ